MLGIKKIGLQAWPQIALAGLLTLGAWLVPADAQAQNITYSEFKFGVWDHDTKALQGREKGIDLNPEVILWSPITEDMIAGAPDWLHWALQPRPTIGGSINTAGKTDQAYVGATWSWFLARNLINPDDGIVLGYFFGPGFNDGQLHNGNSQRKALGSHILFREALDLGYQINPTWEISAYIDHISNGGLAKENQDINDIGIRLGYRF
ncbi:MAG TPA: acyloxyacyl hydrolase [Stellaceae bacterium]|nr:acyloxyacyl hydrolase [Stellaceae bacterium]